MSTRPVPEFFSVLRDLLLDPTTSEETHAELARLMIEVKVALPWNRAPSQWTERKSVSGRILVKLGESISTSSSYAWRLHPGAASSRVERFEWNTVETARLGRVQAEAALTALGWTHVSPTESTYTGSWVRTLSDQGELTGELRINKEGSLLIGRWTLSADTGLYRWYADCTDMDEDAPDWSCGWAETAEEAEENVEAILPRFGFRRA